MDVNDRSATRHGARRILRRVSTALLAAALMGGSACSDASTAPRNHVTGTYNLNRIDDGPLPAEIHHGPWFDPVATHFYNQYIVRIISGRIELDEDQSFAVALDVLVIGDGTVGTRHLEISGTWAAQGATVLLTAEGSTVEADLRGGTIDLPMDLMGKGAMLDYTFRR